MIGEPNREQQGAMADLPIKSFWGDLRRRKVVRVAVVYAIAAWVAVEVSSVMFPSLLLPDWTTRLVVALVLIGFPVALGLAWAFQVTPEGVKPETQAPVETGAETASTLSEPTAEERLDGWKRIAAHLNRDVRTLRRWENSEGLPVRRLMHDKQATVFAYRSELDAWMEQRGGGASTAIATRRQGLHGKPGLRWAWFALPALALGVALAWFWPRDESPGIAFGEWDWVLITEFDNRTGEAVLDGTVEYALRRDLANSQYVKITPPERINDVLQLMQLPPATPIDMETGREISLRDGSIKMLITGRVDKLGNTYQISAELVNPADGVTLQSFSTTAIGQDQILPRIGDLAIEVRTALGEGLSSIAKSEDMLARVTTPSLQALRLYSDADKLMAGPDRARAPAILEEAVRVDPNFASAHLLLSYVYRDRDDAERANLHLERAVALAEHASERERLFILATYYGHLRDHEKAVETYELLLRRYPDHYWANGNLSNIYETLGRFEEAKRFRLRVSELRPNSIAWYPDMDVLQLALVTGDTEIRDTYIQRFKEVAGQPGFEWALVYLTMLPIHEAWINGSYEEALNLLERLVAEQDREALVANGFLFAHLRSVYLALGKIDRFREITAWRPQPGWFEALLDYDSGRPESMRRYLESQDTGFWTAVLLALLGQTERAAALASDPGAYQAVQPMIAASPWKYFALGQLALAEGKLQDAVAILENRPQFLNIVDKWAYLFAMHSLAEAYEGLDESDKAIETLEKAALQLPLSVFETGGTYMWQRNQVYLHQLYRASSRDSEAAEVASELRAILRLADPGHHFLAALDHEPD